MNRKEEVVQQTLRQVFNDAAIEYDKSRFAGGLTNYNYIMEIQGETYVIREPGTMTEHFINRKVERINTGIASELGVNSKCVYCDSDTGVKISVYIRESKNLAQVNPSTKENLLGVSNILKKLHQSNLKFSNRFDWKKEIALYEKLVYKQNGLMFSDYFTLKERLIHFMEDNLEEEFYCLCHNDTVPENFLLDKKGEYYLIDWEYSGQNDPAWDIAAYIIESQLGKKAIEQFFSFYYESNVPEPEKLKIKCYLMAQDLLWTVWALIRHYSGDDFLEYCCNRYERFRKNMEHIEELDRYPIENMVRYKS
ncbi:choline/ethanolamine kinase family protein [Velocimicrobium porci]|uniref:Phosphotransferase n=1 Tax=Velocimicrobium porci TaxID=2606634 RepID=A0A6L5XVX4_9FIRM|nr:choline/ethanolamine kinase family protein [Velocimicrobium porci]MSS62975.1 phosphotransferase [Velocimicrobium porci]